MIKIFEIVTSINLGGAENLTFNIVDHCSLLHPAKFQFIIVELYATKSSYALRKKVELRSKGIKVITLGGTSKRSSLSVAPFSLLYHIKKENPNIIHSHTDLPDFVLGLVLKVDSLTRTKIVRTIHNTELWSEYPGIGKLVESSFQDDRIVGVSKAALEAYFNLRKKYRLPISSQAGVVYNGCSTPKTDSHHFKLDNNRVNVAFCGRFVYQKGIDILVDVIWKLGEKFRNKILFHFVGDGPYKDLVSKLAKENENVLTYGAVSNLAGKIHDFDFLIVPSRFEGLGLISVESSLAKVPVIAARAPGLDETLPPDWPLFFNLNDAQELETIFQKITEPQLEKEALKKTAFDFVSGKFSMGEMARGYSAIYLGEVTSGAN